MARYRDPELKGRPRRRIVFQVRLEEPNCWWCGQLVDLSLPRSHRMSSTVHELIPRSKHPFGAKFAALDRANCRHTHRACNSEIGSRIVTVPKPRTVVRSRAW